MLRFDLACLAFAVCVSVAGCDGPAASKESRGEHKFAGKFPIRVLCTTGMVADLARNVAGEHAQVTSLMGEGVDPHLYKASPADVSQLNRADIVFYSGLHLEGKLGELLERMGKRKPTVGVAERLP